MAESSGNVTIKSIAKRLGVSFSTVSKALNGDPLVNEQTRQLVEKTAREMKYTRNVFASGLRQKGSKTVAIIVNDIDIPAYGEMISSISGSLAEYGYTTMISDSRYSEEFERNSIRAALSWMPEAVIIAPANPKSKNLDLLSSIKDKTLVIGDPDDDTFNFIAIDHKHAGFISAEKMLQNGIIDNLILAGPEGYRSSDLYLSGIIEAYEKHGVGIKEEYIFRFKPDLPTAYRCFKEFWNNSKLSCKGVLCFCDSIAYGIYRAAGELGINIPEDLSVIGYDDGPANDFTNPPLSTVHMPKDLIASHCRDFVINHLKGGSSGTYTYVLKPNLKSRGSVLSKENK